MSNLYSQFINNLEDLEQFIIFSKSNNLKDTVIVSRRYVVDTFNQLAVLEKPLSKDLPDIISINDIPNREMLSWTFKGIPKSKTKCNLCSGYFTIKTAADSFFSEGYYHIDCYKLYSAKKNREFFTDVFSKAGYDYYYLEDIQNEYYSDKSSPYYIPWFKVYTTIGNFVIGRRKNVVSISWSDIDINLLYLFEKENVTKGPTYIHAWSKEDIIRYLSEIRLHLTAI